MIHAEVPASIDEKDHLLRHLLSSAITSVINFNKLVISLVKINLILLDLLRLSRKSRFSSPGMPNTYSQPSASKHSINESDAFVIEGFLILF